MFESFKKLLGITPKVDYSVLIQDGAIVLDVRTPNEFKSGHIKNAVNIPVDQLNAKMKQLKDKDQCIICYCASGMRSGMAKRMLSSSGYKNVYNGGSFYALQRKTQIS